MKKDTLPTNAELEILILLWENGSSTVRQIHDQILKNKNTGYTSTLKIMQNMHDKNMISRRLKEQAHIYYPLLKREQIQKQMLGGFVNKLFKGSSKELILSALGNQETTSGDIAEIREMLNKLEEKRDIL